MLESECTRGRKVRITETGEEGEVVGFSDDGFYAVVRVPVRLGHDDIEIDPADLEPAGES